MKKFLPRTLHATVAPLLLLTLGALNRPLLAQENSTDTFRPPSVPLVVHDPYLSIWSNADRLTDTTTRHWTKAKNSLVSLVRIDDQTYRIMGDELANLPALPQTSVRVFPTRTIYEFANEAARVKLTFTTPALPDDLDILSRPLTYLTWEIASADGKPHHAAVYFSAAADLTVHKPDQPVVWGRDPGGDLLALHIGTEAQPVLKSSGDNQRIDWGYAYVAVPAAPGSAGVIAANVSALQGFAANGILPAADDPGMPRPANENMPVAAVTIDFGDISQPVVHHAMLAYDDLYSINFLGQKLPAYWKRQGMDIPGLLKTAESQYADLQGRCEKFDAELMADLKKVGGEKYAAICALAYRQSLGGNKIVADDHGQALMFPKENTSNGCIATVDVIYPMAPQFLLFNPTLAKASLVPVLLYAASPRWKYPFAPHDLGTYPKATAQTYGGGETGTNDAEKMPVEECGNMIVLLAAIARLDGNADFASRWWPQVTQWVQYLEKVGYDPALQLCTDDFAGHLAHNANLSVKAIEASAAYGMMCELRGEKEPALKYGELARTMAGQWIKAAREDDHYRLAFEQGDSWSQKYNLVWDRILNLNVFPADVARDEIAYYKTRLNKFGLPLDSRKLYTKADWTIWTATMAESQADFESFASTIYDFANHTGNRVPFGDWYWTDSARAEGFAARPVIGGLFIKLLSDPSLWRKYAARDQIRPRATDWAAGPTPPKVVPVVPDSRSLGMSWHYTTEQPPGNWYAAGFNDLSWRQGDGGFGTRDTPGSVVRTEWKTADIWARRTFTMNGPIPKKMALTMFHDEDAEVYINGVLADKESGFNTAYETSELTPQGQAALKVGQNVLAVHCHQTSGGQFIDLGLSEMVSQ